MKELKAKYYFQDMQACPCAEAFKNIEYVWEALRKKNDIFKTNKKIRIGKNTTIEDTAKIEGPVIIGDGCIIRPNAYIRAGSIIGSNVVIGHSAEVKNVIVFNEAKIASHTFVGDAILGKGVRVGSGTIIGNRRFDQKTVKVRIKDKVIDTGVEKYGGIIGDYSRLGANCSTSPGMLIGSHTWIYAGVLVQGFIPKDSLVKLRQKIEIVPKEKIVLSRNDSEGKV